MAQDFESLTTGFWEVPATWQKNNLLKTTNYPDAFSGDTSKINPGTTVTYRGKGSSAPDLATNPDGSLTVGGDGNSNFAMTAGSTMLIDGGTWDHDNPDMDQPLTNAGSIGLTSTVDGTGTVTIQNGGVFSTGNSIAFGVGTTLRGVPGAPSIGNTDGIGFVHINDGTFITGPGTDAIGFGNDDGAQGTVNVGDSIGAAGSALLDLETNGATVNLGVHLINPAVVSGGAGVLNVRSDGRVTLGGGGHIFAHAPGAESTVLIEPGGTMTSGSTPTINIGSGDNDSSLFEVRGTFEINDGPIYVGSNRGAAAAVGDVAGTGQLVVTATGVLSNSPGDMHIGQFVGTRPDNGQTVIGTGVANFAGSETTGRLDVGIDGGNGTLNVTGGTLLATENIEIGRAAASVGVAHFSGGSSSAAGLSVGQDDGSGTLNVSGGSLTINGNAGIAVNGAASGSINLTGGTLSIAGDLATTANGAASASLLLDGGTLDMTVGLLKVDTLDVRSGTLRDVNQIQAGDSNDSINMIKSSAGTLVIEGDNNYNGGTIIQQGTVIINDDMPNSEVIIEGGATLKGNASLGADVEIHGVHAPGNSVGEHSVGGALLYGSTSTLQWELGSDNNAVNSADRVSTYGGNGVTIDAGATIDIILNGAGSTVDLTAPFWSYTRRWTAVSTPVLAGTFTLGTVSADSNGTSASGIGSFSIEHTAAGVEVVWKNDTPPITFWRTQEFGEDAGDPAISGDEVDFDGDEDSNLYEYGTARDPKAADVAAEKLAPLAGGDFEFDYVRNSIATDVTFTVEHSDDLGPSGTWSGAGVTETMMSDDGSVQQWKATIPGGGRIRCFVRLRITRP